MRDLASGATVGGFQLSHVLGEGGMGVVWSAHDPVLDRTLAIKVLKRGDAPALRLRLLREARAMARLKHPNVLTVYEVGTEGERDFIAMELVEGGSLDDWLAHDPPRHEVIAALVAAGRGLAAAHDAGLVHRDFKPHNVLRRKDGRVLVTDFGLARGLGDPLDVPTPSAEPPSTDGSLALATTFRAGTSSRRSDSVLDSPLTRTGAVMGTPAYMAPEQYAGAPPDPRTDQFAYCVTAWQALTGTRPYTGASLDELRKSVEAGIPDVVAALPKRIRAVLVRGLDPDPGKRWPDMHALLAALDDATRARGRWAYAAACGAVAAIALGVLVAARQDERAAPSSCDVTAQPARWQLARAPEPVVAALDDLRRRWIAEHEQACQPTPRRARVDCLVAIRDRIAILVDALRLAPDAALAQLDPATAFPDPAVCATAPSGVPSLALPADEPRRSRALGVLATAAIPAAIDPVRASTLEAEARAIAWPPVVPAVLVAIGDAELARGDVARAREAFGRALPSAIEAGDSRLVARTRLGLLEASTIELEHPGEYADTKPGAIHEELARHLTYARSAIKAAGEEPWLVGRLALLEATIALPSAELSPKRQPLDDVLGLVAKARRSFEAIGDVRRAARAATLEASIQLARGDESALANAMFAARSADEALARAHLPPDRELDRVLASIAFASGDYKDAHRWLDRAATGAARSPASPATIVRGTVRDQHGKPAIGATVVAWTGELHGDQRRLYLDRAQLVGDVAETGADGSFELHAPAGAAIVAQHGALRSPPQLVTPSPTLTLAPTTSVTGQLDAAPGVDVYARYSIGDAIWILRAPLENGQSFELARLPAGTPLLGTIGRVGDGTRRLVAASAAKLAWPAGHVLDVVVRAPRASTVWIFGQLLAPATRAEADQAARTATTVTLATLHPIGVRSTDAGRAVYEPGDRHAVVTHQGPGAVAACVALDPSPTARVHCNAVVVDHDAAVVIDPALSGARP
ncbi:MAG TPA: protein kinase [Kofleriaceae bacterium]|nr:protein kinase [Kofleriaceae bacterium]